MVLAVAPEVSMELAPGPAAGEDLRAWEVSAAADVVAAGAAVEVLVAVVVVAVVAEGGK